MIAAVIANVNRDSDKRSDPFSPLDFIPDYDAQVKESEKPKQKSWKAIQQKVKQWNKVLQGKVKK